MTDFLRDLWADKAHQESGPDQPPWDAQAERLYHTIHESAEGHEAIGKLVAKLDEMILRYSRAIDFLSLHKMDESDLGTLVQADSNRSLAHTALIDQLNIISRQCAKEGLDNDWRRQIGLDRKAVSLWSTNVSAILRSRVKREK